MGTSRPDSDAPRRAAGWKAAGTVTAAAFGASLTLYLVHARRAYTYDEAVTVARFASAPRLTAAFTTEFVFNNHPAFSFALAVVHHVGLTGPLWMRAVPATIGAATVALLAGWTTRRLGVAAGVAAGALLATNALYVGLVRTARGYGLLAFAGLVATIALTEGRDQPSWHAVYAAAIALGIATHLYAVLVVAAHGAYIVGARRFRWLVPLAAGCAAGAVAYAWTWHVLLDTSRAHRGAQNREFLRDAAQSILGQQRVTIVLVIGLLGAGAAASWARRPPVLAAIGAPVAVVLFVWKVQRPDYLYPRFLVVAVVAVAGGVALAVARWRWLLVPALIAAAVALGPQLSRLDEHTPTATAAAYVVRARALRLQPCVVGSAALPAYGTSALEFVTAADTARCDVVLRIGSWRDDVLRAVRPEYRYRWADGRLRVLSDAPRAEFARAGTVRG